MINTRATARFAQSHLPQGNGIQDRQLVQLTGFHCGSPSGLTSVKVILIQPVTIWNLQKAASL